MTVYRHETFCDLVAKGGVTSGVVYPSAIGKLAKQFSFRNLGGTSVGAIAAAAAAAAEYGRRNGGKDNFHQIETLGQDLKRITTGNKTKLFNLFQPNGNTKTLFTVLTAGIGKSYPFLRLFLAMLWRFWPATMLSVVLCATLAWPVMEYSQPVVRIAGSCAAIIVTLVVSLVFTAAALVLNAITVLPRNFYGLCTGRNSPPAPGNPALSEWLADFLDRLANFQPGSVPLTFGNLWWPDVTTGQPRVGYDATKPTTAEETAARFVNLEMITTNISEGRPYRLPFKHDFDVHENRNFWYRPEELKQFLPDRIVDWMMTHARPSNRFATMRAKGFYPLPEPWNLPVIAAVRLSLSFPLLLTAVPLYIARGDEETPRVCWFSDGGICSNFPIHFFDSAIPEWPTFAINLSEKVTPEQPDTSLPESISQSVDLPVVDFDHVYRDLKEYSHSETTSYEKVWAFTKALLFTMHNWNDNTQTIMPGNRDRIVIVNLNREDGGLNLNMSTETLEQLEKLGAEAANKLIGRFGHSTMHHPGTDDHRWVRLKVSLSGIEEYLVKFSMTCDEIEKRHDLQRLVTNKTADYFRWNDGDVKIAWRVVRALRFLGSNIRNDRPLSITAPRPRSELRARPRQ